jgi:hypothetical protein
VIAALLSKAKAFFVQDVPAEIDACEACGMLALHCTEEQAATCKLRLCVEAERKAEAQP